MVNNVIHCVNRLYQSKFQLGKDYQLGMLIRLDNSILVNMDFQDSLSYQYLHNKI
jgi:hypothetical protein